MAKHFHKGNRRRWEAGSASWARRANMRGIWRKCHRDPSLALHSAELDVAGLSRMRMHAQTAMIENGFVHIPESAPWLAEYLHEMTVFPNAKHDDQVDSTAQFLDWFKKPFPGQGIFELYRREDEKLKRQKEPEKRKPPRPLNVRVKARPGIGAVQTFSGRHLTIGGDRIVEMSEEDAFYLIPLGWTILGDA